jgi:tetrahydromethanopterin S-methyltransferase subunit D
MWLKVIFGLVGIALMLAFLAPVVFKLKSAALVAVIMIGLAMMVYDYIEFLRERD